ncbi:MAG: bifunctional ornithine acetyltransferase/N-acetylglutamate synthase, partial [Deltaproteobacteria bacterium]|nr:bifunctional ornithine acetyltransferase/N-acetylglutamate synthase [Deltaproteobacteria bacterium]
MKRLRWIPGGVTAPRGIVASGTWSGIKRNRRFDLALIVSETPATVAGMLTTNRVKAAPVLLAARALRRGWARAVLVNSGCANCMTGAAGARDAQALLDAAARLLGIAPREILPASTGIIGRRLPVPRMQRVIPSLVGRLSRSGHRRAAQGILTTDVKVKEAAVAERIGGRLCIVGGMA